MIGVSPIKSTMLMPIIKMNKKYGYKLAKEDGRSVYAEGFSDTPQALPNW